MRVNMTRQKSGNRGLIAVGAVLAVLMAVAALRLWPAIKRLAEPEARAAFGAWVRGLGGWGVLVMFGLQVLQIVISFLPGEPVEILSGLLYGGFGGLLICLAGCAAASSAVFLLARRFGAALLSKAPGRDRLAAFSFLQNARRLETIVFLLFLIPGAPKDILTYAVGILSPMKLSAFLLLSLPARIPSVATSTFIGANMAQGNWVASAVIFAVTAVIGLLGIRFKDKITQALKEIGHRDGRTKGKP